MATVEGECAVVLYRILEAVQANEHPSSFQNSCTGLQRLDSPESNGNSPLSSSITERIVVLVDESGLLPLLSGL
jgi:hypothetical protein